MSTPNDKGTKVPTGSQATKPADGRDYEIVSRIRTEFMPLKEQVEYLFTIQAPIKVGRTLDPAQQAVAGREKGMDTMVVRDERGTLDAGGERPIITVCVSAQINSELHQLYPDNGYVGKTFTFFNTGKVAGRGGKKFNNFLINEVKLKARAA